MMKIVSGKFGGRKLQVPKNNDIRPTSDKIRGAVFNMLQSRGAIDGTKVLDAFCGTGALGLEALSRGAANCVFMDKVRTSLSLAQDNAQMLDADDISEFMLKDSSKVSIRGNADEAYNLVFLDPPYSKGLVTTTLQALVDGDWIAPDGWIVCESERSFSMPLIGGCVQDNEKTYGDTKITLLSFSS